MQLYQSLSYQNFNATAWSRNTFYLLDHEERFKLTDMILELEDDINERIKDGTLKPLYLKDGKTLKKTGGGPRDINKKDLEAITFLKRICHFSEFPESDMIDPTSYQLSTIVDKLLYKVYNKGFVDWMKLYIDRDKLEPEEMREWMTMKRSIFYSLKDEGLIPPDKELKY